MFPIPPQGRPSAYMPPRQTLPMPSNTAALNANLSSGALSNTVQSQSLNSEQGSLQGLVDKSIKGIFSYLA
jgi:hypothetical protein